MKYFLGLFLFFHSDAHAFSCKDILDLYSYNTPEEMIINMMKEKSSKLGQDDVLCLQKNNAPTAIINAAKKITGVELDTEKSQSKSVVMTPFLNEIGELYYLMQEAGYADNSKIIRDIGRKVGKDKAKHFTSEQAATLSKMVKEAKIDISKLPLIQEQFKKTTSTDK